MDSMKEEKQMDLATIIVPIYNMEKYLDTCLESIIKQSYTNLQIILIDDGSTDGSVDIARNYQKKCANIELYQQTNRGVSEARNKGLDFAKGKYVFFLDSDDYIGIRYIENFMQISEDKDFVGGGYTEHSDTGNGWKLKFEDCEMTMDFFKNNLVSSMNCVPTVHVTGNRYKNSIIQEKKLRFLPTVHCSEDNVFNMQYLQSVKNIRVIDMCEYYYRIHHDSALFQFYPDRLEYEKIVCKELEKLVLDKKMSNFICFNIDIGLQLWNIIIMLPIVQIK